MTTKTKGKSGRGRKPPSSRGSGTVFWAVAVGVVVLFGVAIALTRNDAVTESPGGGDARLETGAVEVRGEALPALPDAGPDPAVGEAAPGLQGRSFDGSSVSFRPGSEPTALVFLAHWCPHCQREVPALAPWLDSGGLPSGVEMLSVSTSVDPAAPNYPPSEWLAKEGWPVPVMADSGEGTAARAYGLTAFPYFVLVDSDGRVAERLSGEVAPQDLEARLQRLR
jgi:cytochrome c biogenesis protein CcmG/thiol:disulfide interchange protein DsbE